MNNVINKIYTGDCLEIMKTFPSNFIDLILTSPPYNIGIKYDNYDDSMDYDSYWKWCKKWLTECYRILKPDGRCAIVHYISYGNSNMRCSPIATLDNIQKEIGFKHHAIVIWNDITRSKYTAWGSWCSASSPYINSPFECILITYKEKWKKEKNGKSTITDKEFMEACSGIWNIGTARHDEHPAVFPLKLAMRVINLLTFEEDIVLDPFCGTGTTCLAAYNLNRKYIGIDLSSKYTKIAENNLKQMRLY